MVLRLNTASHEQLTDETLAARTAEGDISALETLYDRHGAMILGITLRITGDQTLAEEVLQETFWWLWQHSGGYQFGRVSFTAWLFRTARSLALDACQQRR